MGLILVKQVPCHWTAARVGCWSFMGHVRGSLEEQKEVAFEEQWPAFSFYVTLPCMSLADTDCRHQDPRETAKKHQRWFFRFSLPPQTPSPFKACSFTLNTLQSPTSPCRGWIAGLFSSLGLCSWCNRSKYQMQVLSLQSKQNQCFLLQSDEVIPQRWWVWNNWNALRGCGSSGSSPSISR